MAEVMFRKGDTDAAIIHFSKILDRTPDHYEGLSKLIDLLRRCVSSLSVGVNATSLL